MKKLFVFILSLSFVNVILSIDINESNFLEFLSSKEFISAKFIQTTNNNYQERKIKGELKANRKGMFKVVYGEPLNEIISSNGLLLTNHHCGYDAILNHSSVENDYLGNGFWAKSHSEELSNENLFVDFLIEMKDVSSEVLDGIDYSTEETERQKKIVEKINQIKNRATKNSNYWSEVKPFFGGSEFYLFIYQKLVELALRNILVFAHGLY